jgi:hypothetical protein
VVVLLLLSMPLVLFLAHTQLLSVLVELEEVVLVMVVL